MYGCNKLYCEQLGRYYARHYKQLAAERAAGRVDFRCLRFPGLISAMTVPAGGTSDYAPEMIHAAAKGEPYACFVRPDTRIPFMAMPDGDRRAAGAGGRAARTPDPHRLQRPRVQPVGRRDARHRARGVPGRRDQLPGRRETAGHRRFAGRPTSTTPRPARDWGFAPRYDLASAFTGYLIPTIRARYRRP